EQACGETQPARRLALVCLDLDNFKEINDEHGHAVGDRVLERFGMCLAELVRSGDYAFRVGGDEFALLLADSGEREGRDVVARLVTASRAIAAEQVSQRMLRVASRELTLMLSAEACLVSRLEDGLLREVADYSVSNRQVARGLSYYLADYPTTAAVLESNVPCAISADDAGADPAELFVLREMEMNAVLLVPIVVETRPWGLIEIYDVRARAFSGLERHLAELGAAQ